MPYDFPIIDRPFPELDSDGYILRWYQEAMRERLSSHAPAVITSNTAFDDYYRQRDVERIANTVIMIGHEASGKSSADKIVMYKVRGGDGMLSYMDDFSFYPEPYLDSYAFASDAHRMAFDLETGPLLPHRPHRMVEPPLYTECMTSAAALVAADLGGINAKAPEPRTEARVYARQMGKSVGQERRRRSRVRR